MAVSYDIDSKQISDSIAIKHGIAALLTTSAYTEQRSLDAYIAEKQRADEAEERAEAEKQRADKAEQEVEYWKNLALELQAKPRVVVKGKAKINRLVTGDVHEIYAQDNSNTGQQHKRIGAGR
ncbi:MAG: hypothetical protein K6F10_04475 [Paludibacteraceae bacterium]|nr:hypothetical protein [Paludibacteraceae bacterium]